MHTNMTAHHTHAVHHHIHLHGFELIHKILLYLFSIDQLGIVLVKKIHHPMVFVKTFLQKKLYFFKSNVPAPDDAAMAAGENAENP